MSRPSDGWDMDELREEFDWMCEFYGRMAERIRGDADVHNLADYVARLESENDRLRDISRLVAEFLSHDRCEGCVTKRACNAGELDHCWMAEELVRMLGEVGEQVDW